jgi:hypothetical protein
MLRCRGRSASPAAVTTVCTVAGATGATGSTPGLRVCARCRGRTSVAAFTASDAAVTTRATARVVKTLHEDITDHLTIAGRRRRTRSSTVAAASESRTSTVATISGISLDGELRGRIAGAVAQHRDVAATTTIATTTALC